MTRFLCIVLCLLLSAVGAIVHAATVIPLNDTGQTQCYDDTGAIVSCSAVDDSNSGRDADAVAGELAKIGAGDAGFDFTKIGNDGTALAAGAALGSNPADWACTRDNVTGLIWEMKTAGGLHSSANTYSWYSTDADSNGGIAGTENGGICSGSNCDTAAFIAAVNAATLCGASDWRLPTIMELTSIVDANVPTTGVVPTIDTNYFPNTQIGGYWTAATYAGNTGIAWEVNFNEGIPDFDSVLANKSTSANFVRLVRGGQ